MKGLLISEVAKIANVNIETIRYYEKRGLITKPPRAESGYRRFPNKIIDEINFIKRGQELGFTLDEIKQLILIYDETDNPAKVKEFTDSKIKEIESKIEDLIKMKLTLTELSEQCPGLGSSIEQCPIINALAKG